MTSSRTPPGIWGAMRARLCLAASMTATVFSPDCRRTSRMTLGTPFSRATERCSAVPSSARPTSRTRMGAPLTVEITTSSKARGSATRPRVRSEDSRRPAVTLPPGMSAFWRTSASRTAVMGSW